MSTAGGCHSPAPGVAPAVGAHDADADIYEDDGEGAEELSNVARDRGGPTRGRPVVRGGAAAAGSGGRPMSAEGRPLSAGRARRNIPRSSSEVVSAVHSPITPSPPAGAGGAARARAPRAQSAPSKRPQSAVCVEPRKSNTIGGYEPPEAEVSGIQMEAARRVASNADALRTFMNDPRSRDACKFAGILPEELEPRPRSAFKREPDRAAVIDVATADKRYEHFEARRTWKLAVVIAEREKRTGEFDETTQKALATTGAIVEAVRMRVRPRARLTPSRAHAFLAHPLSLSLYIYIYIYISLTHTIMPNSPHTWFCGRSTEMR
jgi:hypothetical protein